MAGYIPPEKMTVKQIREEIDKEFDRWNALANGGCCDPFWPDGVNMNLVRNHISYWYKWLAEKIDADVQMSLFGEEDMLQNERPLPPKVPEGYMVIEGEHSNRLSGRPWEDRLVFGHKGDLRA